MKPSCLAGLPVAIALLSACAADPESSGEAAGSGGRSAAAGGANGGGGSASGGDGSGGTGGSSGGGGGGATSAGGSAGGGTSTGGSPAPADGGAGGSGGLAPSIPNPWGVAPSHSSSLGFASWAAEIAGAGFGWVRGFDRSQIANAVATATANDLELAGIFFFSDPGPEATFPVNSLPAFADYVTQSVNAGQGKVRHWEVWNEPPNFTANKDPAAYAQVVVTAYDATKAADPSVQVGLAAQSNNVSWLAQTLDAGAADHFDYVTVHPYETLGLVADGWEAEYMSIVPTLRKLLADKNPAKANVPVWFTELGEPVGGNVTPEHQADTLVKAYVMGIAQGATRVHWFEPLDGDSGPFGLIGPGGGLRPAGIAARTLVTHLGEDPRYVGWLLLDGTSYGFVFDGPSATVLVAWAPPGATEDVTFGNEVTVLEPGTGAGPDTDRWTLNPSPVVVVGVPSALRDEARANRSRPFPWGGDFSAATEVSFTAPGTVTGLHPLGAGTPVTIDGTAARDQSASPGQGFTVDPNFSSYTAVPLRITAVVRRIGAESAGFNLKYESTTGWKGTGSWFTVPEGDAWQTQTWDIDDPQFAGKWGYNFSFDSDSTQNSRYAIRSVTVTKR